MNITKRKSPGKWMVTWQLGDFERLDKSLSLVVPDVNVAIEQTSKDPGFGRVNVDALHSVRACGQLSFDFEPLWKSKKKKKKSELVVCLHPQFPVIPYRRQ
jgi:hypothetical protein